jgi:apolipoprotein D and lipocalin family protein
MRFIIGFLFLSLLFFNQGCSTVSKNLPEQTITKKVEIPKFMGRWYVIASIPTMFETDAYNATESYTWNSDKDRIDIDFKYNKDSATGPIKRIPQKGFIYNKETNAEWRVEPLWPFKFAYLIIDLAPDYSYTIIGVPNRKHVWIMAREPQISDALYKQLVKKVDSLGYDISKLQKVPQAATPISDTALSH